MINVLSSVGQFFYFYEEPLVPVLRQRLCRLCRRLCRKLDLVSVWFSLIRIKPNGSYHTWLIIEFCPAYQAGYQ